ncbi:neur_chan_memb domain-containing protein [Caerostris darwini]|uniref:Neur_chan_memb domain-containing protein n=1 Tax=Caerostris darwini TaxID=1538125 RepID=A0AAV4X6G4_9ARAC|nr:neur_chan_memb domain-containing protein [Caerostris darwini]
MERPGHKITRRDLFRSTKVCEMELKERASRSLLTNIMDGGGGASGGEEEFRAGGNATASSSPAPQQRVQGSYANVLIGGSNQGSMVYSCMHADVELSAILRELKVITAKLRKDDRDSEVVSDWQFAAMVVDRICLINFTIFTVASTVLSLGSAPHLMA